MKVPAAADRRTLFSGQFGTFYYRTDKATFVETSLWRDLTPLDYFLYRFKDNACFQTAAWLVSRELTDAAGPWTDFDSPDDDGEYFCRVVTKSTAISFVPNARTLYRVGNSRSWGNQRFTERQLLYLRQRQHASVFCWHWRIVPGHVAQAFSCCRIRCFTCASTKTWSQNRRS